MGFSSKIGAILAAAGSAVGLGNIWRFPTETGVNGGAAFILIYVLFMIVFGAPVMLTEFTIGRYGQKDVADSFERLSGGRKGWRLMGLMPVVAGLLVLSYYTVVCGWTLYYAYVAGIDGFAGKTPEQYVSDFQQFAASPTEPLIWILLIMIITCGIISLGVRKGIERGAKILMPLLFVCIIVLVCFSVSLPNADRGLKFLFYPDFSKINGSTALSAMGQAFFSLSVGIGCLCTYACYFRKDVNLFKDSLAVAVIDTLVALMAGLIIFPAVYSVSGLTPDAGPSLVFITLPNVFQHVFGGASVFAYAFSLLFYVLLVIAAITSSISMLEMVVAYFHEEFGWSRPAVAVAVSIFCMLLAAGCSLSFGVWADKTVFGLGMFDLFDFIVAKLLMPIGSFVMCIFLGWVVDEKTVRMEVTNGGKIQTVLYPVWRFIIRYFAPIGIILIFINEIGW